MHSKIRIIGKSVSLAVAFMITLGMLSVPVETRAASGNSTGNAASTTSFQASSNAVKRTDPDTLDAPGLDKGERRAVWFSYDDLDFKKKSKSYFKKQIDKRFRKVRNMKMNTVVVHVRPFSDALYRSSTFPHSSVLSKKQGKDPGFDALSIMVASARKYGLRIEAWINPYRITLPGMSWSKVSKSNPAKKWYSKKSTRRNVLYYRGQYYYNPSKAAVRNLITDGVREIVRDYDIDAIHFDDYFYPSFTGVNPGKVFDSREYSTYKKNCRNDGVTPKSISSWRRSNVNKLVKGVYSAVKKECPSVEFGISPAGNIQNLRSSSMYYVDIDRWLREPGYVDYICPQIYWGFDYGRYSFDKVLNRWLKLKRRSGVKLYVGMAVYNAAQPPTSEWYRKKDIIARSVRYARKKNCSGFYFFTDSSFYKTRAQKEVSNLKKELGKR